MRTMRKFVAFLLVVTAYSTIAASPSIGKVYSLKLLDVDGRNLSTGEGVVTVLVIATRANLDKAREVGDRIPERCLGNPGYRMITVIGFGKTRTRMMQYLLSAAVRHGLDSEAARLKTRYLAKGINRNPRSDLYAVADFNDHLAAELDLSPSTQFQVLVLSRDGTLIREWTNAPSAEELAAALP